MSNELTPEKLAELRRDAERCASDPNFPHDGLGRLVRALPALLDAAAERDALAAAVERVRSLHVAARFRGATRWVCSECCIDWPCPTIRALDESEADK